MKKIILGIAILITIVAISGCSNTNQNVSSNIPKTLQKDITISEMSITPAAYGKAYDMNFILTYNGDKPINGRLWIEPYPIYGSAMGESDIPEQKYGPITKGQSFKIELSDVGGFNSDPSKITGYKLHIGVNYRSANDTRPDDAFYTETYNKP